MTAPETKRPGGPCTMVRPESDRFADIDSYRRYEFKYLISPSNLPGLRKAIAPHVDDDPHGIRDDHQPPHYTVRSIYFDSDDLRFYYERVFDARTRKKIRIRTYDRTADDAPAFLEIKRKVNSRSYKDRIGLPLGAAEDAIAGRFEPPENSDGTAYRRALERFRFNVNALRLKPVVLVTYDREAYGGRENPRCRVTVDRDLRCLPSPRLDQIGEGEGLIPIGDDRAVLEMKFDHVMPRWMVRAASDLGLIHRPYSKFCYAVEAGRNAPH